MIWFTADHHFRHANVIEFCKRPFADLEEMTESLIERWNKQVARGDVVYHLGDFAMTWKKTDQPEIEKLLSRLHGSKHLICGNHDREAVKSAKGWQWVGDYKRLTVTGQGVVLFHYAIRSWHAVHRGSWHLYGHSHGSLEDIGGKCMDVGVDCHDYAPISWDEVKAYMENRSPLYVDHHNAGDARRLTMADNPYAAPQSEGRPPVVLHEYRGRLVFAPPGDYRPSWRVRLRDWLDDIMTAIAVWP